MTSKNGADYIPRKSEYDVAFRVHEAQCSGDVPSKSLAANCVELKSVTSYIRDFFFFSVLIYCAEVGFPPMLHITYYEGVDG